MGVGAGLYMYDAVVKKFTFAISSPDEFLLRYARLRADRQTYLCVHRYARRDRTSTGRSIKVDRWNYAHKARLRFIHCLRSITYIHCYS